MNLFLIIFFEQDLEGSVSSMVPFAFSDGSFDGLVALFFVDFGRIDKTGPSLLVTSLTTIQWGGCHVAFFFR